MIKNLISSYITKGILLIFNLIYVSVFISLLGIESYGLFSVSLAIVNLFLFFNTGIGLTIIKYLNDKNFNKQNVYETLVISSLVVISFLGLIQIVFSSYIFGEMEQLYKTIFFVFWIFTLMFVMGILSSILNAEEHIHEANVVEVLFNFLKLALGVGFIYFFALDGAYLALIFALLISVIILLIYIYIYIDVDINISNYKAFDWVLLKKMIRFIWFNSLNEGIWRIFSNVDKILISKLFGNEILGYYNIAYVLVLKLWDFPDALSKVAYPRFSKLKDNYIELQKIYNKMASLNVAISLVVNTIMFIFAFDIITLWLNVEVAKETAWMLQIMIIGNTLSSDNWVTTKMMLALEEVSIMFKYNLISLSVYFISLGVLYFIFNDITAFLIAFIIYYTSYTLLNRIFVMREFELKKPGVGHL